MLLHIKTSLIIGEERQVCAVHVDKRAPIGALLVHTRAVKRSLLQRAYEEHDGEEGLGREREDNIELLTEDIVAGAVGVNVKSGCCKGGK